MNDKFSALIIDDEHFAREELIDLLQESHDIEVIGEATNAIEGLKKIHQLKPDVVFLDIQMPMVTGIDLIAMLDPEVMPKIIFVTAYDQYAVQAFDDNAFDYLLKPIDPKRLNKTLHRLQETRHTQPNYQTITPQYIEQIPCIGHQRIMLVNIAEVEFACSEVGGVKIQTMDQKLTTQLTLKVLEEKTPLMRCHRQYLIHLKAIKEIKLIDNGLAEIVTHSHHTVPVSRRYFKELKERLGF
ncbi:MULTISPECIES: two-component system response regulator BtsR [Vibrio]|uniref:Two-component system response regulator BtsR n=2 Tax=Vibrio TaxID=662 RepID=A0A7X4LMI3_9VIBR|nr:MULTISPECIES: two-component system response regulator BtsR [Vibrio]MBF8999192.1 two-component system response regulator BtsR [Vibrio nitrifigilis]MZI94624.1 two-component system response regulator BtsR [Vibrio eleionomae]